VHITSTSRALHSSWTEASRGDRTSPEHVLIQQSDKCNNIFEPKPLNATEPRQGARSLRAHVRKRADGRLRLRWIDAGGPIVTPPSHRGFGTRIMENIIANQLKGEVHFDWRDQGLACEIALQLA
jgi:hypothetical protein